MYTLKYTICTRSGYGMLITNIITHSPVSNNVKIGWFMSSVLSFFEGCVHTRSGDLCDIFLPKPRSFVLVRKKLDFHAKNSFSVGKLHFLFKKTVFCPQNGPNIPRGIEQIHTGNNCFCGIQYVIGTSIK